MCLFSRADAARSDGDLYHDPIVRPATERVPLQSVWARIISPAATPSELVHALSGLSQLLVNPIHSVCVYAEYPGNIE
jgi:hypothetical protein